MASLKRFAILPIVFLQFSFFAMLDSANAGECKVSRPKDEVLADAKNMSDLNEISLDEITQDYESRTGQRLEVVIVARAGTDFTDQVVLKDFEGRSPLTIESIYRAAQADRDSMNADATSPDYAKLKEVIATKFGEANRRMAFSHVGFMIRNHPRAPALKEGEFKMWRARHMLRPCYNPNPKTEFEVLQQKDLNVPYLWDEGSLNFFADDPYQLKARYIVPAPELQARLMDVIFDEELIYNLNSRYYNAGASWKNTKESNSNQWVLEVLAAATRPRSQVQSRADAQDVLAKLNYRPTKVLFKGQKAMAYVPVLSRQIAPYLTYHSDEQPYYFKASIGEVISALSVEEFMKNNGLWFDSYITPTLRKTEDIRREIERAKKQAEGRSSSRNR